MTISRIRNIACRSGECLLGAAGIIVLTLVCMIALTGGCQSLDRDPDLLRQDMVFIAGDARAIAQDVRAYLDDAGDESAVERMDQLIAALTTAEQALSGDDYDITAIADQLRLAWLVAKPFVPEDHQVLAQLIATSVDRVLVRLEWHAEQAADDDGDEQ